jgi:hypothetical protein
MTNQLAEDSVRTYHLASEGFAAARNRLLRQRAVLFVGILLFLLGFTYKEFHETWRPNSIASFLPALFVVLILLVAIAFGLRKGIKRNRESWDSFELLVGQDFVIRKMKDFPELEIQRHEVTRIRETSSGLYVETQVKDRTIGIARTLVNYEDARERLSRWLPPVHEPQQGWTAPTRWMWMYPVITLVFLAVFFISKSNLVIVATGIPLVLTLFGSIWLLRRSVQVSTRTKRQTFIFVLPLLAIIARLILAIQNLR